jgi:plastocyanin
MARMARSMLSTRRRVGPVLAGLAVLVALLAGCGGGPAADIGFSSEPAAQQLEVAATDKVTWAPNLLEASAGDVTFVVHNPTSLQHNFEVEGNGVKAVSRNFKPNATVTLTVKDLKPGTYRYVCTVAGHEATMFGTLVVH